MDEFIELVSKRRLAKYEGKAAPAADLHIYNTRLCESFYPALSYLEIFLRNRLDKVFSAHFGDDWVYKDEFTLGGQKNNIATARASLAHNRQNFEDKSHLVAELPLGFWTAYFRKEYRPLIWDKVPGILDEVFPKHKGKPDLDAIDSDFNYIRRYRNKVFHYGSIIVCEGKLPTCRVMSNKIYIMIQNIASREVVGQIAKIDRFDDVYMDGVSKGFVELVEV